jgi:hypothetical protein
MATITFHSDEDHVENLSGSGLGFYGNGFGTSVEVGEYQDSTFITDGTGTIEGAQVNNVKYTHPNSGNVNGVDNYGLQYIANKWATLNIRFSHTSAVKTQNAHLRIYDRSSINNPASGVVTKVAQLIHPATSQVVQGSGDTSWSTPGGSSIVLDLVSSPGYSGERPNGAQTTSMVHDWYAVISQNPTTIGSKTMNGLYFDVEYL